MQEFNKLKTLKSVFNKLYNISHLYTSGLFSDTSWENIHNIFSKFSNIFPDFSWYVENGGYSSDGKSKTYIGKFTVKTNYFTKIINFKLTAYAAGTIENPWKFYDMSMIFY